MSVSLFEFKNHILSELKENEELRVKKTQLRNGLPSVSVAFRGINANIAALLEEDQFILIADMFHYINKHIVSVYNACDTKQKFKVFANTIKIRIPELIKSIRSAPIQSVFKKHAVEELQKCKLIVERILVASEINYPTPENIAPNDVGQLIMYLNSSIHKRNVSAGK